MKTFKFTMLLFSMVAFSNCKKENKINKNLEGVWNLTEYNRSGGFTKSDFTQDKMSLEFSKYKKAYTQTMKGVFVVDFTDQAMVDVRDTFSYELKNDEFVISKIKAGSKYTTLLKNRFKIEEYKDNKLKIVRIDSTDLYIKATK